jgi:DNA-binding NarL/FixJ family response regulator
MGLAEKRGEILRLSSEGFTQREIARELRSSLSTVNRVVRAKGRARGKA